MPFSEENDIIIRHLRYINHKIRVKPEDPSVKLGATIAYQSLNKHIDNKTIGLEDAETKVLRRRSRTRSRSILTGSVTM